MKSIPILICAIILLTACSVNNNCQNRFKFISCSDSIPILNLDITQDRDTIRKKMNELYGIDLCEKCSLVDFRLPIDIEGKKGFIKVMADFDSPFCENCPIPIRKRHYFSILINQENMLLAENELTEKSALQSKIVTYLESIGNDKNTPKVYEQVNFSLSWGRNSNRDFINSILTILHQSHLAFVESQLEKSGIDICGLKNVKIDSLKTQFPLNIEFSSGKIEKMAPPERIAN